MTARLILLCVLLSCNSSSEVRDLSITNCSEELIDSVSFHGVRPYAIFNIAPGERRLFHMDLPPEDRGGEAVYPITFYRNSKIFRGAWGRYYPGITDTVFSDIALYEHGIGTSSRAPHPQSDFYIYLVNRSSSRIDSIKARNGGIKHYLVSETAFSMWIDFAKFIADSAIQIRRNDVWENFVVPHDWYDWNRQNCLVTLDDNGMKKMWPQ